MRWDEILCNTVNFKFRVSLEFFRRHVNLKQKRFDFCVEYKPTGRICQFHYHWLDIFGLLEETATESSIAF